MSATYTCKNGQKVHSDLITVGCKDGSTRYRWTSFRGLLHDGYTLSQKIDLLPNTYVTAANAVKAAKRAGCEVV